MSNQQELNFESAIVRLEQIVRSLENGSVPLDDALSLFEEGIRLVKLCNEKLTDAESRIKLLTLTASGVQETDFPKGSGRNGETNGN